MKVAINARPVQGPWGGGNRFVQSLSEALVERGHRVSYELAGDADIALIIDPRARNPRLTFTAALLAAHLRRHPDTIVVHRINECDERKATRTMNARLRIANYGADFTVFIASWLEKLTVWRRETPSMTILNGADPAIFRLGSARIWDGVEPLRIVTHHWGAHANKGWDVYQRVDALAGEDTWRGRIALTYIGNVPAGMRLEHFTVLAPLDGASLATALAENHVYLTASINEPAGMHHIEGALTGLPLLYRRSGALPEYCDGYGEPFDGAGDVVDALSRMMTRYPAWKLAMSTYPHTSARMTDNYINLFERLCAERGAIVARRRPWRDPLTALLARVPL